MKYFVMVESPILFMKKFMETRCYKENPHIQLVMVHYSVMVRTVGDCENPVDAIDSVLDEMEGTYAKI